MVSRLAGLLALGLAGFAMAAPPPAAQDVPAAAIERAGLLPADLALLDEPRYRWQHLQTEHFILHHDQKIFAAKVARLGEQFYAAISADLPNLTDRAAPARSHVFIFRDPRDWQRIVAGTPGMEPWSASFVRGQAMYLQETGTAVADKMETLAHEMTHLVFNRFLPVRLPLWLNEGLAEYYGEFAYRAAKGMGQSKSNAFRPLRARTPLAELLDATAYPADPADVARFYATSKYFVGYLLLKQPRARWDAFFAKLLAGAPALPALLETYGWADVAAAEKAFATFAR
ncbi:MAG TPA: hypothetical protein P5204_09480 [Kiritimatiellia bacterium]|nr:hypothetical protein [Kiritimatiellia bacterium]